MLTSEPLAELLSPEFKTGDQKHATDMAKIINNNQVLYLGLDSLADGTVGSAIGSIMLADLTAVAGDRYNYGIASNKPVNLFIDEAAEVINQPTIQLKIRPWRRCKNSGRISVVLSGIHVGGRSGAIPRCDAWQPASAAFPGEDVRRAGYQRQIAHLESRVTWQKARRSRGALLPYGWF
ncbi:MAG: hypothetical protein NTV37_09545 [Proteobacteria bacterium]|nr:hypothetical protein [Pseudomonadota bacterium]